MSEDTVAVAAVQPTSTPKKKTKGAPKKTKSAPTHPKVSEMVLEAITELKERGGSSLQAIKKHVSAHNKVDMDRLTPFIKKFLKSAVASGALVQTKGKGATGSFKLGTSDKKSKESKPKAAKPKKEAAAKKKTATPRKAPKAKAEKKKKPAAAKRTPVKKAAKPKSPKKTPKPKAKKAGTPKKAKKAAKK